MTSEDKTLLSSVRSTLRTLKRVQKLQPKMKLQPLIEQTELLVKELQNPNATVESIEVIGNEIDRLKKANRWR